MDRQNQTSFEGNGNSRSVSSAGDARDASDAGRAGRGSNVASKADTHVGQNSGSNGGDLPASYGKFAAYQKDAGNGSVNGNPTPMESRSGVESGNENDPLSDENIAADVLVVGTSEKGVCDLQNPSALEDVAGVDKKSGVRRRLNWKSSRRVIGGLFVILACVAVAGFMTRQWGVSTNVALTVQAPTPSVFPEINSSEMIQRAIEQATSGFDNSGERTRGAGSNASGASQSNSELINETKKKESPHEPIKYSDDGAKPKTGTSENSTTSDVAASGLTDSSNPSGSAPAGSRRNTERSILVGTNEASDSSVTGRQNGSSVGIERSRKPVSSGSSTAERTDSEKLAIPSFGSMLPVRSLGAIFTLRSGGLVRFELTRSVEGDGWSLPKGTVLVGALRGSEFDRAFISIIGFIDSTTGKFAKVTGDILGSDGASGLKGKRHKVSGGWSKVLSTIGEAGMTFGSALVAGLGRGPVIISDAYRGSAGRVTNEVRGVITPESGGGQFVEISAGTSGYVMVTRLPDEIHGVDAVGNLSQEEMVERSDVDRTRAATGLTEREMAELIESGRVDQIRAALPRMTAEMRKIAVAVLRELGG